MAVGPEVANEIRRRLAEMPGMTQRALAEDLGISTQLMSDWLQRESGPPIERWHDIEQHLRLPDDHFLRLTGLLKSEGAPALPVAELIRSVDVVLEELTRMQELLRRAVEGQQAPGATRRRR